MAGIIRVGRMMTGRAGLFTPVNTVLPAITGTPTEGETLTVSNGTWLSSPTSYTYQWKDDGVAIGGATASTYELTASEVGATITATVTATNASGSTSATSAGVGPVVGGFLSALVKKAADQTGANYATDTAITWNTETTDVGGWHNTGANTTRFTVPSGVNYVRLSAGISLANVTSVNTDAAYVYFLKNGTGYVGVPFLARWATTGVRNVNLVSPPIEVVAGDYFECYLRCADTTIDVEDYSWAAIERVA
jgi:hypothetical protein